MALARRLFLSTFDLWDRAIALFRRVRRGYPSPEDFRRMGPEKSLAYFRKIGLDQSSELILARYRAEKQALAEGEAAAH